MAEKKVSMATELVLPTVVRQSLQDKGARMLDRYQVRFGMLQMHMHVKRDGPQIACNIQLKTDNGRYHAAATAWDPQDAVHDAIDVLSLQINKRLEKEARA